MTLASAAAIAANVARVRARLANACERSGRDARSVTLGAVSKMQPAESIMAAMAAGVADFGENYAQEGIAKLESLSELVPTLPTLHFIGHIQTNKARLVVGQFSVLHGIDSPRLLRAVAATATTPQEIFIQVNVAAEATKGGIAPGALNDLVAEAKATVRVRLLGLMTVPPPVSPERTRDFFRQLRLLAEEHGLKALSMGMTDDFEVAIEEGATHIRVGRAIFGERSG